MEGIMVRSIPGSITGLVAALCVVLFAAPATAQEEAASEQQFLGQPNSVLSARPTQRDNEGSSLTVGGSIGEIIQVILATAGVVGLILVTRAVLRRVSSSGGGSRASGVAEVVSRMPLGKGQSLIMLKLPRRVLVLHATGTQMTTLTEFTDQDDVAHVLAAIEGKTRDTAFGKTLRQFEGDHANEVVTPEVGDDGIIDLTSPRIGLRQLLLSRRGSGA
jgi:flagellar biogenesis protein FliO